MTEYEYLTEVVARREAAEAEEKKHDCESCTERLGVPCLKAHSCTRMKKEKE